jgi:hypothetical protein
MQQFLDLDQPGIPVPLNAREADELAAAAAHAAQTPPHVAAHAPPHLPPHGYHALTDRRPAGELPRPPVAEAPAGIAVAAPISLRPR